LFLGNIHTKIFAEGLWDKLFDTEIVAALGCPLSHENYYLRNGVVKIFIAIITQGVLCFFFLRDMYTELFTEGLRDKIFDTEIIAALGRALSDETSYIRNSAVEIFTAAVAQGALRCFHGIFIPKYL